MNRALVSVLALAWVLPSRAVAADLLTWNGTTMGTRYTVKLAAVTASERLCAELRTLVEQRFEEINRQMSHYRPDSELSRFNRSRLTTPTKVSTELARVTRHALEWSRESGGAFDPTLEPLLQLWGFDARTKSKRVPSEEELTAARQMCGARHLRVIGEDQLQKDIPELQFNLSAIAKGYAADEAARLLRKRGYTNVFVAVSGEIVACGVNPNGRPWQIGVERPHYSRWRGTELSAVISLSNRAVSTSGDTHNFFQDADGRIRSHILDPLTGRPVEHQVASVTVVAPDALTADGVATALFVMGVERGLRWVEERPSLAALFIVREDDGSFRLIASRRFPTYSTEGDHRYATRK